MPKKTSTPSKPPAKKKAAAKPASTLATAKPSLPKASAALNRQALNRQEAIKRVLELVEEGHFVRHACEGAGISHATWYNWVNEDPRLLDLQREAELASAAVQLRKITSDVSWQSAAWFLERKFPEWRKPELQTLIHQSEQTITLVWPEEQKKKDE